MTGRLFFAHDNTLGGDLKKKIVNTSRKSATAWGIIIAAQRACKVGVVRRIYRTMIN